MKARYETHDLIAWGDGGTVHRGWDRQLNLEVAIKRAASAADEEALINEAAILRRIRHPNIVSILDSGRDDEGPFIVMELVQGRTLEEAVRRCPLDVAEFEQLAVQTMDGIAAAHAKDVLHLDLKPENIIIANDPDGRILVTLLDFGAGRTMPSSPAVVKDEAAPVMGSLFFIAPERFDREPGDARSDLYSLGCVYYYALTRQSPFRGDTAPQVMVAHLLHQFTPLAAIRPDLPAFIASWVEWLLSRRPEDRPANAATALAAFRQRQI